MLFGFILIMSKYKKKNSQQVHFDRVGNTHVTFVLVNCELVYSKVLKFEQTQNLGGVFRTLSGNPVMCSQFFKVSLDFEAARKHIV